jgi:hypothetical protein
MYLRIIGGKSSSPPPQSKYIEVWSPPPYEFIKINFNEASKGNPSSTRIGRVFRDSFGNFLRVYTGFLGIDTNNEVELVFIARGIHIDIAQIYERPMVEVDSLILVNALKSLLKVSTLEKPTKNKIYKGTLH